MDSNSIVIVSAKRTPIGNFLGYFKDTPTPVLGAYAIQAALQSIQLSPETINETIMGCVLSAGLGQAPARQAAIAAGIPHTIGATTVNKMCGSGMRAIMSAYDAIRAGSANVVVAGGMENMSQAPYLVPKARTGYPLGHGQLIDHMFYDGLEDAYHKGQLMGCFAEATAQHFGFNRQMQDDYAIQSLQRALKANQDGTFALELISCTVQQGKSTITVQNDEQPFSANLEKIPTLKPAFHKEGTVTAANSSSISDGAAALILTTLAQAEKHGLKPLARMVNHATFAQEPQWFTTAPIGAIKLLLDKMQWKLNEVDLIEINEAFAVVAMAAMRELKLSHQQLNIHGGACALGHPIGASGARIVVTLLHAMAKHNVKKGIASVCIGGGEATAIALERM